MINRILELFENEKRNGKSARSSLISAGLSEYDLQQWKSGRNVPTYEKLIKLAKYFQVSADYLLGLTEVKTAALPDNAQIMPDGWKELNDKQRETIMDFVRSSIAEFKRNEEEQNQSKIKNSL